jgi:regulatory protein
MRTEKKRSRGPAKIPQVDIDVAALGEPLIVTAVVQVPGRNDRLTIALNGATLGDVTLDFVAEEKLRQGRQLTPGIAENTIRAVQRTRVLDKALDLLAVRARSARELSQRLRRAGAMDPEIAWVQDRLLTQGFLDDASFARQVARGKVLAGGTSRRRVIGVLRKKGVSADIAEEAIDATLAEVELDEFGAALAAAERRIRALRSLEPQKQRQRLYAFLARRGYEQDVIRRVTAELLPRR